MRPTISTSSLLRFDSLIFLFIFPLLGSYCVSCGTEKGESHDDHDGHSHEEKNEGHPSGEIILSPKEAEEAGVITMKVETGEFSEVIKVAGRILTSPTDESTVVATRSGIVKLTRPWTQGMSISSGSPLFTISQSKLPEGDASVRARINLTTARQEYERIEKLYKEQLATATEYETARNAYENARLTSEALANGGNGTISSSRGGYILQCLVKDGDFVEVGAPLMTLTGTRRLQLQADLPVRELGAISRIVSANFRLPQNSTLYRLSSLNGRLVSYSRVAEGNSAYVPMVFEFDNSPGVIAGSFAEIFLIGGPRKGTISVPLTAITEEQGIYYVYVKVDEEGYMKRRVIKGATDGENVEILDGLEAGETVVVKGAVAVKLASMSGSIPGHTHEH